MPRAKRTEYAVAVDTEGRFSAEEREPVEFADGWTPEHLLLAALADCSLKSLEYHARRASVNVLARAATSGAVGERDDGSWGFVEIESRIEATFDPAPPGDELRGLLSRAERGCFVGGSLRPRPTYRWHVNGEEVR